jgi:hypothetical protein
MITGICGGAEMLIGAPNFVVPLETGFFAGGGVGATGVTGETGTTGVITVFDATIADVTDAAEIILVPLDMTGFLTGGEIGGGTGGGVGEAIGVMITGICGGAEMLTGDEEIETGFVITLSAK